MKNKIFFVIFLLFIFILFSTFKILSSKLKPHKVLDIIRADLFYVDINDNSKIDEGELFKLSDIYTFSPEINNFTIQQAQKLHIDIKDYSKAGYLAQNWAIDNLKGKEVVITSLVIDKTKKYNYIKVSFMGEDLSEFYLKNGLAAIKNEDKNIIYQNIKQIKQNSLELSKLNFVLLNLYNGIYHKLSCEYSNGLRNAKLILEKEVKEYIPCKSCINKNTNNKIAKTEQYIKPQFYKDFNNIEIYFTDPHKNNKPNNSCSNKICKRLVQEINQTNSTLDIALYGIGDIEEVYEAIKNAKNRNVKIRVVADYSKNTENLYPKTKDLINDFKAKTDKSESIMHNKFIVFDNKKVYMGTANISPSGIGDYSANTIIFIDSEVIAKRYAQEFEQMYKGNFSIKKNKYPIVKDKCLSVYFSPKDNVKDLLLSKINSAKEEICISAFYLTNREIINALIEAKKRNINIFIIQDAVGANNFKDRIYQLRKSGIKVIVENWGGKNHEKNMVIDNKIFISGSTNFSNAGFFKNDENMLVIENEEIAKLYRNYFFYLYNSIDKKYLKLIPRAEGIESKNSCSDGIDNNFDGKTDKDDIACQ